ncbi:MAG: C-terminal helicase domain-containing protein, partial [Bacteroidales bacterium]|nr:C-terminal helicase domain-containing protein [Bacteroidales bacterium]
QSKNKLLFERLFDDNLTKNPSVVGHLIHQGRMHPEIAKFANSMFYSNRLEPIPLSHQLEIEAPMPRYFFLDVKPDSEECHTNQSTKCNVAEARKVSDLVKRIFDIYCEKKIEINAKTLGIIVPYRNQISAIRKELALRNVGHSELINIDTAERYQGSQRDIIIFTATVSTPNQLKQLSAPVMIEGQMIDRKLNVIITRARKHLFIVGNKQLLCDNPIYRELIEKMS